MSWFDRRSVEESQETQMWLKYIAVRTNETPRILKECLLDLLLHVLVPCDKWQTKEQCTRT